MSQKKLQTKLKEKAKMWACKVVFSGIVNSVTPKAVYILAFCTKYTHWVEKSAASKQIRGSAEKLRALHKNFRASRESLGAP